MARPLAFFVARSAIALAAAVTAIACASGVPAGVLETGTRTLRCSRSELDTTLNRDTGVVREYYVGCNFMYSRVHCRGDRCYPAPPEPPCMPKVPCFKENPKTLEWEPEEELALHQAGGH
ncbi:MAG TPA: hypothetical protein VF103_01225 [Polyangiaceae bacterium]